jgi:8-oxo-dGTP diphosphatase
MEYRPDQEVRINNIESRAIVVKETKLLLMFRRKNGEEYYVLPGGHMREGETPEQTCIRELFEETAVKIHNIKPALQITDFAKKKPRINYYFISNWESGVPKLNGEEIERCSEENYFEPMWVDFDKISVLTIYSAAAKEWILENIVHK